MGYAIRRIAPIACAGICPVVVVENDVAILLKELVHKEEGRAIDGPVLWAVNDAQIIDFVAHVVSRISCYRVMQKPCISRLHAFHGSKSGKSSLLQLLFRRWLECILDADQIYGRNRTFTQLLQSCSHVASGRTVGNSQFEDIGESFLEDKVIKKAAVILRDKWHAADHGRYFFESH